MQLEHSNNAVTICNISLIDCRGGRPPGRMRSILAMHASGIRGTNAENLTHELFVHTNGGACTWPWHAHLPLLFEAWTLAWGSGGGCG